MKKILHMCLPDQDNLGDRLGHQILKEFLDEQGIKAKTDILDLKLLMGSTAQWLDDRIDEINKNYDMIVIGAGGLLGFNFLPYVFKNAKSWTKIKTPIVFFGLGAIYSYPPNTKKDKPYSSIFFSIADRITLNASSDQDTVKLTENFQQAIKSASLVSVRDYASLSLVKKFSTENTPLYVTGCPTLFSKEIRAAKASKKYDMGFNIPFSHGALCKEKRPDLEKIALFFTKRVQNSVWICHSKREEAEARKFLEKHNLSIPLKIPKTFREVGETYGACRTAIVTKLHAAYFSMANKVPFSMISYDMKCDALLSMLYDIPAPYCLNLYDSDFMDLDKKLLDMVHQFNTHGQEMQLAIESLMNQFQKDHDNFAQDFKKLIEG